MKGNKMEKHQIKREKNIRTTLKKPKYIYKEKHNFLV